MEGGGGGGSEGGRGGGGGEVLYPAGKGICDRERIELERVIGFSPSLLPSLPPSLPSSPTFEQLRRGGQRKGRLKIRV